MSGQTIDIVEFLARIDMSQLVGTFQAEDIDMSVLPLLESGDLAELGLTLGQRKKLTKALGELDQAPAETVATEPATERLPIQLRRLSVLFCDMVGSTDLGERLDIDEMQDLLAHYYDIARRIATEHEGHIATVQGDGVIMLFGFPRVREGIAGRAVQAAMAFQKALADNPVTIGNHDPIAIETRIGVATGKAAVGEADGSVPGGSMHLVGPVVNRAARLQTVARQNGIAVDGQTRTLTEAHFGFSEPEDLHLKGLQQDVAVSHVERIAHGRGQATHAVNVIGRDTELSQLAGHWETVREGKVAKVSLAGEAGVGKSTLLQAFFNALGQKAARIIHLQCSPLAHQTALWPIAEFLEANPAFADADDDAKPQALARLLGNSDVPHVSAAAKYLGIGGNAFGKAGQATDREDVLDLLCDWITARGDVPTVLALEDAHWSDPTTKALMTKVAERAPEHGTPILMLSLSREDEDPFGSEGDKTARLTIGTLDDNTAEALLSQAVGNARIPQSVRRHIMRHSGGNPLMIETLAHSLEHWHSRDLTRDVQVPHTIYESVSSRLDGIRSGRRAVEVLAVLNAPADLDLLGAVMEQPPEQLGEAVFALSLAGLITEVDDRGTRMFQIRHQVYRDVIYEQITGQSRQKLHAAAYRALHDLEGAIEAAQSDILALHAHAAQDRAATAIHALDAGERMLRQSALVEASHFFDMAEEALEKQPDDHATNQNRLRAITGKASVERSRFGIATDASGALGQRAVELARAIGDSNTELLALNGLYAHSLVRADYRKAQDYADELHKTAEKSQNKTFVMIATRAIGVVALHKGDFAKALEKLRSALDQYDRDTHLPLAHLHGYDHAEICAAFLSFTLWVRGDLAGAREMSDFSIKHSRDIDHAHSLGQAMAFRVMLGALARDEEGLVSIGQEAVEFADRFDLRVMRTAGFLFPFASRIYLAEAEPDPETLDELRARVDAFRALNPFNYAPLRASLIADIMLRGDETQEAETLLSEGQETQERTGESWTTPELLRIEAKIRERQGAADKARELRHAAFEAATDAGSVMFALRIACDMAEDQPDETARARIRDTLENVVSRDEGWDLRRAEALLQTDVAA